MILTDTHSHIYEPEFDTDREAVIARAAEAGVRHILLPAIDSESHERLFGLCRRHMRTCLPMMGLHPTSINDNPHWHEELAAVERYLAAPPEGIERFYAVGEIGLDFYWSKDYKPQQTEAFRQQIDLAIQYGLPVVIHVRDAADAVAGIIAEYRESGLRGVFHAYSGSAEQYRTLKKYGDFAFGIGGVVTFKNSSLADIVREMDMEDIVLETDSPYLTPAPYRGKRNEPGYIQYICQKIAEIKDMPAEKVAEITTTNAVRIFGIR